MLRDFPKIIRIMRQKTVPSCLNPSANISQMYELLLCSLLLQSPHTRANRKHTFQFVIRAMFFFKKMNRCLLCFVWEDKSVPPSIINGSLSEKPLLKSLIASGEVSRPSGGYPGQLSPYLNISTVEASAAPLKNAERSEPQRFR